MAADPGVGGFLDKFEEHFGKRWTKRLVLLIALGISSGSFAAVWQFVVSPLLRFFAVPGMLATLLRITAAGASLASGMIVALGIYDWYLERKIRRQGGIVELRQRIEIAENLVARLKDEQSIRERVTKAPSATA